MRYPKKWWKVLTRLTENADKCDRSGVGGPKFICPGATQNTEPTLDETQDCAQWSIWFQTTSC